MPDYVLSNFDESESAVWDAIDKVVEMIEKLFKVTKKGLLKRPFLMNMKYYGISDVP